MEHGQPWAGSSDAAVAVAGLLVVRAERQLFLDVRMRERVGHDLLEPGAGEVLPDRATNLPGRVSALARKRLLEKARLESIEADDANHLFGDVRLDRDVVSESRDLDVERAGVARRLDLEAEPR